jgi:hypothetical protein
MSRIAAFCIFCLCAGFSTGGVRTRSYALAAQNTATEADRPALEADHAFLEAAAKGDHAALDALLDGGFTWTDAAGRTLTRTQVLREMPKPLISDARAPGSQGRNYGELEAVQEHKLKDNILRIWVKRAAGWRLLIYQDTRLMNTPPAPTVGTGKTCENPCKIVPYTPKNANEKDVLAAYMALQTATVLHDSATWGKYVAEEFRAANSNSNQVLDKQGRMADLERSKMAGYSPMPVVSMQLFDFGNVFVLVSQHQPEHGKPVHITRLWIKRGGQWQEAASYQTRIEGALAQP